MPTMFNNRPLRGSLLPRFFPQRRNPDGSFDSICTRCFQTIASGKSEPELAKMNLAHVCDAGVLGVRQVDGWDEDD